MDGLERITMEHGAGGTLALQLVKDYVLMHLGGSSFEVPLKALDDAAVVDGMVFKLDGKTLKSSSQAKLKEAFSMKSLDKGKFFV